MLTLFAGIVKVAFLGSEHDWSNNIMFFVISIALSLSRTLIFQTFLKSMSVT